MEIRDVVYCDINMMYCNVTHCSAMQCDVIECDGMLELIWCTVMCWNVNVIECECDEM